MVQALRRKGVPLDAISKILPSPRLRVIQGELSDPAAVEAALQAQGAADTDRYYVDMPLIDDGRTYVLTKMWGLQTVPTLTALRDTFESAGSASGPSFEGVRRSRCLMHRPRPGQLVTTVRSIGVGWLKRSRTGQCASTASASSL